MITKKQIQEIKKRRWEHFYKEPANILAYDMAMSVRTREMKQTMGIPYRSLLTITDNGEYEVFIDYTEDSKIANNILRKILNDKNYFTWIEKNTYDKSKDLLTYSRKLRNQDFNELSNKALANIYQKFTKKFMNMRKFSSVPTVLEHGSNIFTEYLRKTLSTKISQDNEKFNSYFSILTTPEEISYIQKEKMDLLKIQKQIYRNPDLEHKLLSSVKSFVKELEKFPKILKMLNRHEKNYTWKNYTFQGTPLSLEDFIEEIKTFNNNPDFELKNEVKRQQELKQKRNQIIRELKLNKQEQRMFEIGKKIVYIKYFRKGTFSESYYNVERLLAEIGKRIGANSNQVRNMFRWEAKDALSGKKIDLKNIDNRMKHAVIIAVAGNMYQLYGKDAKEIEKNIVSTKIDENIQEIKGQCACPGKVAGKVCIVNNIEHNSKIKEGEVMVSRSTNPNLVPAMRKASAFVTDLGGLTCHAAIVSREMQKPCIIGTKIATKILQDGDYVEVNANTGVITKLKDAK